MSHPENTLRQIIERQNKRIDLLTEILDDFIEEIYRWSDHINYQEYYNFKSQLEKVRNLK